ITSGEFDGPAAARAVGQLVSANTSLLALYDRFVAREGEGEAQQPASSTAAQAAAKKLLEAARAEQLARERASARRAAQTLPAPTQQ
ncbi:MAG: hypothetical protein ACOYMN_26010, partial [Roseimicrobium sp.]